MKKTIKKLAKSIIGPLALRLGYVPKTKPLYSEKNSLLHTLCSNLQQMGFEPKHIIDVGANHGKWTRELLRYFPKAHYTLLEPQQELVSSFQDILDTNPKIHFLPVGAGASPGSFTFTLSDRDDSSSFRFSEEEARQRGFKQIQIPVVTLNQVVKDNPDRPKPDLIKIDAEGMDIEVLNGASDLFGYTEVFLVEATVSNKAFQNDVGAMIQYMNERGYRLFEITDLNRPYKPAILWLVELVFIKRNGSIDQFCNQVK
jgi:FkbM family methyltransferase